MRVKKLVVYSLITALYTVLSLLLGTFSFSIVQVRISEGLMVLALIDKKYIYPLTIGCFLTNLIGVLMGINLIPLDILFGTLATFIAGVLMYKTRNIKKPFVSLLVGTLVNTIIVSLELTILLSNGNALMIYISNFLYVLVGEFISLYILGLLFIKPIDEVLNKIETF